MGHRNTLPCKNRTNRGGKSVQQKFNARAEEKFNESLSSFFEPPENISFTGIQRHSSRRLLSMFVCSMGPSQLRLSLLGMVPEGNEWKSVCFGKEIFFR